MAFRPHPRAARTDPSAPQAWATCGRCNFVYNLVDLKWQDEWRGTRVVNTRVLVCETCYDELQRQLGTVILPPDPVAVRNARPESYAIDEAWPRLLEGFLRPRFLERSMRARTLEPALYYSTGGPDHP